MFSTESARPSIHAESTGKISLWEGRAPLVSLVCKQYCQRDMDGSTYSCDPLRHPIVPCFAYLPVRSCTPLSHNFNPFCDSTKGGDPPCSMPRFLLGDPQPNPIPCQSHGESMRCRGMAFPRMREKQTSFQ